VKLNLKLSIINKFEFNILKTGSSCQNSNKN